MAWSQIVSPTAPIDVADLNRKLTSLSRFLASGCTAEDKVDVYVDFSCETPQKDLVLTWKWGSFCPHDRQWHRQILDEHFSQYRLGLIRRPLHWVVVVSSGNEPRSQTSEDQTEDSPDLAILAQRLANI